MAERSPNFPSLSLGEAIEAIGKVYSAEGRTKIPRLSVVKPLGYTSINGRSLSVLGALKAYGLLDGRGDDLKVSDDAFALCNAPASSEEYQRAIATAFASPPAFQKFSPEDAEASDDTLIWKLQKEGFKSDAAEKLVKVYRESKSLLNPTANSNLADEPFESSNDAGEADREVRPTPLTHQPKPPLVGSKPTPSYNGQPDFVIKLGGGRVAYIEIVGGEVTPTHLTKLERFIRLQKELIEDDDADEAVDPFS